MMRTSKTIKTSFTDALEGFEAVRISDEKGNGAALNLLAGGDQPRVPVQFVVHLR